MPAHDTIDRAETKVSLRHEPVQARSTARLTALLDASARVIDEIGFERLTTAMVADRAGASIGTVYRYFPDRIALLQALGARNLERVLTRVRSEVLNAEHTHWVAALSAAFAVLVDAYRNEPGFRGLRVGDALDVRPSPNERTFNSLVSDELLDALVDRFAVPHDNDMRFRFETAIEVCDALATRAFARDPQGDERFLIAARDVVFAMLEGHFGSGQSITS